MHAIAVLVGSVVGVSVVLAVVNARVLEGRPRVMMGSVPLGVMMGSVPLGVMMGSVPPGVMMGSVPLGGAFVSISIDPESSWSSARQKHVRQLLASVAQMSSAMGLHRHTVRVGHDGAGRATAFAVVDGRTSSA